MIDIYSETVVSMTEAAKQHDPGRPHPSSLWWQAQKANRNGIQLETIVCGGKRMTSVEAIKRYIIASTEAANRMNNNGLLYCEECRGCYDLASETDDQYRQHDLTITSFVQQRKQELLEDADTAAWLRNPVCSGSISNLYHRRHRYKLRPVTFRLTPKRKCPAGSWGC